MKTDWMTDWKAMAEYTEKLEQAVALYRNTYAGYDPRCPGEVSKEELEQDFRDTYGRNMDGSPLGTDECDECERVHCEKYGDCFDADCSGCCPCAERATAEAEACFGWMRHVSAETGRVLMASDSELAQMMAEARLLK